MSARYFLRDDGSVLKAENTFDVARWQTSDIYTEVRIVPADAIVIERSELPEVDASDARGYAVDGAWWPRNLAHKNVESIRRDALAGLAFAEHLVAHPPIDEVQVDAIVASLRAADVERSGQSLMDSDYRQMAMSLIRAGVRVVTS